MPSTHSPTTLVRDPRSYNRIETEKDYEEYIEKIEELWDAAEGTPEAEARDFLVRAIEEYEERYEDLS